MPARQRNAMMVEPARGVNRGATWLPFVGAAYGNKGKRAVLPNPSSASKRGFRAKFSF